MSQKQSKLTRREFLKATGVLVGGAAAGSVLAACVPATPEPEKPAAPAVVSGAEVEQVEPITVLINDSPWFPGFERLVNYYEEQTGNEVNLDVTPFPGMLEKTNNAATADESQYDIVNLNEGWYAHFYAGKFMTPILDIDPDFELDPNVISYNDAARWDHDKNWSTPDGIIYGLPINGNIQLLYYRADLYEEAGMDTPETWEDCEEAAKKYHAPPNFYGHTIRGAKAGISVTYNWLAYLRSYGGDFFANPPEDWTVIINNDAAKKALDKYLYLANTYGPPNSADIGQSEQLQLLITDKTTQVVMVIAAWGNMDDPERSLVVNKVNTTVTPRPAEEGGKHSPTSGIWVMGIPQNLPDNRKKAGLTFLEWSLTYENQLEYTKFGAVPVRQDVYQSELAQDDRYRWMKAMADSTPHIHPFFRFPEGPQMAEITELRLNQAVAGELGAEEALDLMAEEIFQLMDKAGYATGTL